MKRRTRSRSASTLWPSCFCLRDHTLGSFYEFALNERTRARVDEHARVVLSARFEEALELSKLSHLILAVCGMNAAVMLYAMDLGWSIHM